jgi:hypothetical protein
MRRCLTHAKVNGNCHDIRHLPPVRQAFGAVPSRHPADGAAEADPSLPGERIAWRADPHPRHLLELRRRDPVDAPAGRLLIGELGRHCAAIHDVADTALPPSCSGQAGAHAISATVARFAAAEASSQESNGSSGKGGPGTEGHARHRPSRSSGRLLAGLFGAVALQVGAGAARGVPDPPGRAWPAARALRFCSSSMRMSSRSCRSIRSTPVRMARTRRGG